LLFFYCNSWIAILGEIADELCSRDSNKIMSSHSLIDYRSLFGVFDSSHLVVVVTEASFKGGLMANCNGGGWSKGQ